MTYFRAERPPGIYEDPQSGWGELALGGMEIYTCPGAHAEIVFSPALAKELKACLEKARSDAVTAYDRFSSVSVYTNAGGIC